MDMRKSKKAAVSVWRKKNPTLWCILFLVAALCGCAVALAEEPATTEYTLGPVTYSLPSSYVAEEMEAEEGEWVNWHTYQEGETWSRYIVNPFESDYDYTEEIFTLGLLDGWVRTFRKNAVSNIILEEEKLDICGYPAVAFEYYSQGSDAALYHNAVLYCIADGYSVFVRRACLWEPTEEQRTEFDVFVDSLVLE